MYKFTRDDVLNAGAGRALEILEHVAGIRGELLDGHHHPCPKCGGTDRFRLIDKGRGAVYCNQCFNRKNRDFLSAVIWMKGCTFPEALELTAEHLGLKPDAYGGQAGDLRSVAEYVYTDPDGNEVYKVERHEQTDTITDDGKHPKKMIQYHAEAGAWKVGLGNDPDGKKLSFIPFPYHLGQLLKEGVRAVFICEGEKCADALQAVFDGSSRRGEYVATTISGGSNNSKNWGRFNQYLGDLPVYILPDHDDPGYKAGREAYKALKEANSDREILLIRMDKGTFGDPAPKSYDVADWIEEWKRNNEDLNQIAENFFSRLSTARLIAGEGDFDLLPVDSQPAREDALVEREETPFPVEVFPEPIRRYVENLASAFNVPLSYPGTFLLSIVAGAVGYRQELSVSTWQGKRALFHSFIVGRTGEGKTPVLNRLMRPVEDLQEELNIEYRKQYREYEADRRRKPKSGLGQEDEPSAPPIKRRLIFTGATTEGIFKQLDRHEEKGYRNGIFWKLDEGAELFEGMDAYSRAKKDASQILKLLDGSGVDTLRSDTAREASSRDSHVVCIGGIQPEALIKIADKSPEFLYRGLFQRFSYVYALPVHLEADRPSIDEDAERTYSYMICQLIKPSLDSNFVSGDRLDMTDEGEQVFKEYEREIISYVNAVNADTASRKNNAVCSYLKKSLNTVVSLVIVIHALRSYFTEIYGEQAGADAETVAHAVTLAKWYSTEFKRILDDLGGRAVETPKHRVIGLLIDHKGEAPFRAIYRKIFKKNQLTAGRVMDELEQAGTVIRVKNGKSLSYRLVGYNSTIRDNGTMGQFAEKAEDEDEETPCF